MLAKRVAIIVHNSIVTDSRVMRAAAALAEDGYEVDGFGIGDLPVGFDPINFSFKISLSDQSDLRHGYGLYQNFLYSSLVRYKWLISKLRSYFWRLMSKLEVTSSFSSESAKANICEPAPRTAEQLLIRKFSFTWAKKHIIILRQQYLAKIVSTPIDPANYDILYCHDIPALLAGVRLKKKYRHLKLVWDAHEIYDDMGSASLERSAAMRDIIKKSRPFVDGFITINSNIANYYLRTYAFKDPVIILNACDAIKVRNSDSPLRKAISARKGDKIILYQGGFSPGRGIEDLVDAAQYGSPDWHFVFMGEGPIASYIRSKIKQGTCGGSKVHLLPSVPRADLEVWSSGADFGVIPYRNTCLNHLYCTPNKLWEYPAAGVPIIATGLIEIKKRIDKFSCGIALPEDWLPKEFSDLLKSVSEDTFRIYREGCADLMAAESFKKNRLQLLSLFKDL